MCQKLMCEPGSSLTCGEGCACVWGGHFPQETAWDGGEVKGVACWYCVCVFMVVCVCVCDVAGGAEQQNSGHPDSKQVSAERREETGIGAVGLRKSR